MFSSDSLRMFDFYMPTEKRKKKICDCGASTANENLKRGCTQYPDSMQDISVVIMTQSSTVP